MAYPQTILEWIGALRGPIFTQAAKNLLGDAVEQLTRKVGLNPGVGRLATYNDLAARVLALEDLVLGVGAMGFKNLRGASFAGAENTKVGFSADKLLIEGIAVDNFSGTADITQTGTGNRLNGLDTGSEANSTWYAAWTGVNTLTRATGMLFSTSFTRAGLVLTDASIATPVGGGAFDRWVLSGAAYNNGSGNLRRFRQRDDFVSYVSAGAGGPPQALGLTASQTTYTTIATSVMDDIVPPGVTLALLRGMTILTAGMATGNRVWVRPADAEAADVGIVLVERPPLAGSGDGSWANGALNRGSGEWVPLDASQQFQWRSEAAVTNDNALIECLGYRLPLGR